MILQRFGIYVSVKTLHRFYHSKQITFKRPNTSFLKTLVDRHHRLENAKAEMNRHRLEYANKEKKPVIPDLFKTIKMKESTLQPVSRVDKNQEELQGNSLDSKIKKEKLDANQTK